MLSRTKGVSVEEMLDVATDHQHATLIRSSKLHSTSTLKSNGSNKFRLFTRNTKRSAQGSVIHSPVDPNSSVFNYERGKGIVPVNLDSLLRGMEQFRFITGFVHAGHVPEIALIGAMMDLVSNNMYKYKSIKGKVLNTLICRAEW